MQLSFDFYMLEAKPLAGPYVRFDEMPEKDVGLLGVPTFLAEPQC